MRLTLSQRRHREWIHFGSPEFPDWNAVQEHLDAEFDDTSKNREVVNEFPRIRFYVNTVREKKSIQKEIDMQKIQKFQFGRLYAAPKSTKTYELIDRNGRILTFRGRNPKTGDSWKQLATSTYQADETGAFEVVLLSDGTRLRGDMPCPGPRKATRRTPITKEGITKLMAALDAA